MHPSIAVAKDKLKLGTSSRKRRSGLGLRKRRSARKYYHVVLRGTRREPLVASAADRRAINQISIEALQRFKATLHGYCLMPHSLRAIVQIEERQLPKALRLLVSRYSNYRRRHSRFLRHVFERPYEAQRIDTGFQFLNLLRFMHLSPVIANDVVEPIDYRWSSHRAYVGFKSVAWISTSFGLSLFSDEPTLARAAYHQFMAEDIPAELKAATARFEYACHERDSAHDAATSPSSAPVSALQSTQLDHSQQSLQTFRQRAMARLLRKRKREDFSPYISIY